MVLSVIIPTYNGKKYIKECVASTLKIDCDKEILIIDDGSIDDSFIYMKKWFQGYQEVTLLRKKNEGIVDSRNFGLSQAKGKYVIFQDHDDIICSQTVFSIIKKMENESADIGIWSTELLLEDGERKKCDTVLNEGIYLRNEIYNLFLMQMLINEKNTVISYIGHVWQAIYKREIIEKYKITFKRFVDIEDDYLFIFDFLLRAQRLITIRDVGYFWRYNRQSETYKRKIIPNVLDRYRTYYNYLINEFKKGNSFNNQLPDDFFAFLKQDSFIMSIENSCVFGNSFWKRYKYYHKELYKNKDIEAFTKKEMIRNYEKRRKRIFVLLKHKALFLACLYVYIDSLYRLILKKVRG